MFENERVFANEKGELYQIPPLAIVVNTGPAVIGKMESYELAKRVAELLTKDRLGETVPLKNRIKGD